MQNVALKFQAIAEKTAKSRGNFFAATCIENHAMALV